VATLTVSTASIRKFLMVSSGDHLTGIVGATVAVLISKASSVSFVSAAGTVSEVSLGWYQITLTSGDVSSMGDLAFHCSATSADATDFVDQVVSETLVTLASMTHTGAVIPTVTSVIHVQSLTSGGFVGSVTVVTSVGHVQSVTSVAFVGSVALVASVVSVASLTALPIGSATGQISLVSGQVMLQSGTTQTGITIPNVTSVVHVQSVTSAGFVGSVALVTSVVSVASLTALPIGSAAGQVSLVSGAVTLQVTGGIKRNAAFSNFEFLMVSSGDHVTPQTGLTIAATRSIDGGTFTSTGNAATEVANGIYTVNLAASDVNGQTITFRFTASGADTRLITIVTNA